LEKQGFHNVRVLDRDGVGQLIRDRVQLTLEAEREKLERETRVEALQNAKELDGARSGLKVARERARDLLDTLRRERRSTRALEERVRRLEAERKALWSTCQRLQGERDEVTTRFTQQLRELLTAPAGESAGPVENPAAPSLRATVSPAPARRARHTRARRRLRSTLQGLLRENERLRQRLEHAEAVEQNLRTGPSGSGACHESLLLVGEERIRRISLGFGGSDLLFVKPSMSGIAGMPGPRNQRAPTGENRKPEWLEALERTLAQAVHEAVANQETAEPEPAPTFQEIAGLTDRLGRIETSLQKLCAGGGWTPAPGAVAGAPDTPIVKRTPSAEKQSVLRNLLQENLKLQKGAGKRAPDAGRNRHRRTTGATPRAPSAPHRGAEGRRAPPRR
jgi:hypothetical protein